MNKVDLWLWSLDIPLEDRQAARDSLVEAEIVRADRFVKHLHRDRYIAGRAWLRKVLGSELGCDPRDVALSYGPNGKPFVDGGPHFNLSHSAGLAVLAISRSGELGVDIEKIRPIERSVARRFFSSDEVRDLSALPSEEWLDGFYRCWTRKEALVKAIGSGLSMPLGCSGTTMSVDPGEKAAGTEGVQASDWSLVHFEPDPGWMGALAMRTAGHGIRLNWCASAM